MKLVAEILFPERARAIGAVVDLLKDSVTTTERRREYKKVTRFLEDLQDELQSRLEQIDADFKMLDAGERQQAYEAVKAALEDRTVSYAQIAASNFDPSYISDNAAWALNRDLRSRHVSDSAVKLAQNALSLASADLSAILRAIPNRDSQLILETFMEAAKNSERVQQSLQASIVPRFRVGEDAELRAFTHRYLNSLIATYGLLEQFGLRNVDPAFRWQPLDLTYISVSANNSLGPHQLQNIGYLDGDLTRSNKKQPVERSIASALTLARQANLKVESAGNGAQYKGLRLIIEGKAGSGKTTVARWLAVQCARSAASEHAIEGELRALSGYIPFIVNLRAGLPSSPGSGFDAGDLLKQIPYRESAPGNWLATLLTSRRVLLILDGLDELAASSRSALVSWIGQLSNRHPEVHVILTSRPEGVDPAAFGHLAFSQLSLAPLDQSQILRCASLWFQSAISGAPGEARSRVRRAAVHLASDIQKNVVLREMLDTPLLVALVCAYYAAGITAAPVSRGALLREVSAVLVHNREEERGTLPEELSQFAVDHKFELLGIVAQYMFDLNKSTISLKSADGFTSSTSVTADSLLSNLRSELQASGSQGLVSPVLLRYLSERSVIFYKVNRFEGEFVHRSFLEYFAAYNLANRADGTEKLLSLRNAVGWANVAAFFAAVAPKYAAEKLLLKLLSDDDPNDSALTYAILECAGNIRFISETVWDKLEDVALRVVPPSSDLEVGLLAGLGTNALNLLSTPKTLAHARAIVETVVRIGGHDAVFVLSQIVKSKFAADVTQQLVDAWPRFSNEPRYISEVLAKLDLSNAVVTIDAKWQVGALPLMSSLRKIVLNVPASEDVRATLPHLNNLVELDATKADGLDLSNLPQTSSLRRLGLPKNISDASLRYLLSLAGLTDLHISDASGLSSLDSISVMSSIRRLSITSGGSELVQSISDGFPCLEVLRLQRCRITDVKFLVSRGAKLRSLILSETVGLQDLGAVSQLRNLERLRITGSVRQAVPLSIPDGSRLREMVAHAVDIADFSVLAGHGELRRIEFTGPNLGLNDLGLLSDLTELRSLAIGDARSLRSLNGIERLPRLERLSITDALELRELGVDINADGGPIFENLRHLCLDGCRNLASLTPVLKFLRLEDLSVLEIFNESLVAPLMSVSSFTAQVVHEDWWFNPADQMSG